MSKSHMKRPASAASSEPGDCRASEPAGEGSDGRASEPAHVVDATSDCAVGLKDTYLYALENLRNFGKRSKCSVEQHVLERVYTLGHFPAQLSNTEDATKEELQNHNLYKQIKNREKDMLQSSRDFLQSMRAHTKVRHRRESAQKILTEARHLGIQEMNSIWRASFRTRVQPKSLQ